jgi:peptidoglycan/LPS O-acetylase OafA/YrhL
LRWTSDVFEHGVTARLTGGAPQANTKVILPGLDLLRAFAIVWVMLYHLDSYGMHFPVLAQHGWMAVDLFFVLSGYLVGGQLLKPYASGAQPQWRTFMIRRAFRVWPAYLAVLALYLALPGFRESDGIAPLWQFLTFTTNLFPDYFLNRAYSHAWSLCVEEHFYLLLPVVVWIMARQPTGRKCVVLMAATLLGGMLLRGWLWQHEVGPYAQVHGGRFDFYLRYVEVIYNPTYNRLDGLLAGVALALVESFRPLWWSRAMRHAPAFLILGMFGVVACTRIDPTSHIGAIALFPMLALSLTCVVVAAISPRSVLGCRAVPGAKTIALVSFSLYLTHKQVYSLIHQHFGDALEGSDITAFVVYNAAALLVAGLLYLAIERPGLMLRDRLLARARRHVATGVTSTIA